MSRASVRTLHAAMDELARQFDELVAQDLKLPTRRSVYLRNADGSLHRDFNAVTVELSDYRLREPGEPN